ncbi:hypothetical protein ABBQ38_012420 [Trebouxia sp. C0009 RCD-2024]
MKPSTVGSRLFYTTGSVQHARADLTQFSPAGCGAAQACMVTVTGRQQTSDKQGMLALVHACLACEMFAACTVTMYAGSAPRPTLCKGAKLSAHGPHESLPLSFQVVDLEGTSVIAP